MVKIIKKIEEERIRELRKNKLVQIANELLGNEFEISCNTSFGIFLYKKPYEIRDDSKIFVSMFGGENRISVGNPEYLDEAIELARAYEFSGESEFTVKKNYDE